MLQYSHCLCLLSEFSTLRADGFEPRATVSSLDGCQWATPIARHKITIFVQTKKSGGFIRVRVLQWSGPDKSCINITLKGHMAPGCWGWGWGEGGLKYELFFPHSFISLGWNWDQKVVFLSTFCNYRLHCHWYTSKILLLPLSLFFSNKVHWLKTLLLYAKQNNSPEQAKDRIKK